jgi:hypothetical protein
MQSMEALAYHEYSYPNLGPTERNLVQRRFVMAFFWEYLAYMMSHGRLEAVYSRWLRVALGAILF